MANAQDTIRAMDKRAGGVLVQYDQQHTLAVGTIKVLTLSGACVQLDESGRYLRNVASLQGAELVIGARVLLARITRQGWVIIGSVEKKGSSTATVANTAIVPQPQNLATSSHYGCCMVTWNASYQDIRAWEVQVNTSESESGATLIVTDNTQLDYYDDVDTYYFRVRGVGPKWIRGSWTEWVSGSVELLTHGSLSGRDAADQHPAGAISVSVTNFDNNLSAADDTVQKALETLDDVAGVGTFSELDDTPAGYPGAGQILIVNAANNALEFTDALTVNNGAPAASLTINANGEVGIGAAPTDVMLYVYNPTADEDSWLEIANANQNPGLSIGFGQTGTAKFYNNKSGQIQFGGTGTSFYIYMDVPNRRLGVGASSPNYLMHMHENTGGDNYLQFTNTDTGITATDGMTLGIDGSDETFRFYNYEGTKTKFGGTGAGYTVYIDHTTGNVGIGTAAPGTPLEVDGWITSDETVANNGAVLGPDSFTGSFVLGMLSPASAVKGAYVQARGRDFSTDSQYGQIIIVADSSNAHANAGIIQLTQHVSGVYYPCLTVAKGGYVGIGTTAPTATLELFLGQSSLRMYGDYPGCWLQEDSVGYVGVYLVMSEQVFRIQRRATNYGAYVSAPMAMDMKAPNGCCSMALTAISFNTTMSDYDFNVSSDTVASALFVRGSDGHVGINTLNPGQVLDVNQGSGNMIADGYDTHSLAKYKEELADMDTAKTLEAVISFPPRQWKKTPFVSTDELVVAAWEHFGSVEDEWGDIPTPKKYLEELQDEEILEWINARRVELVEERRPLPEWQRLHYGLVADDEAVLQSLPAVVSRSPTTGEPVGISLGSYVGVLHAALIALEGRIKELENA